MFFQTETISNQQSQHVNVSSSPSDHERESTNARTIQSMTTTMMKTARTSLVFFTTAASSLRQVGAFSVLRTPNTFSKYASSKLASTSSTTPTRDRLFPEEVNVIYDSKCGVCKLEIDWLSRRDHRINSASTPKLKMTDLESDDYDPSDPANGNVSYAEALAAIHAVTSDGKVLKGVEVFALAYQQVGLGWLFAITKWPGIEPLVQFGYEIFAKYRTVLTRGSKMDSLIEAYEEKKVLEREKTAQDCETCKTNA
jgi:predicted DCC family thiol-disulfide oxidoreductase YuxK